MSDRRKSRSSDPKSRSGDPSAEQTRTTEEQSARGAPGPSDPRLDDPRLNDPGLNDPGLDDLGPSGAGRGGEEGPWADEEPTLGDELFSMESRSAAPPAPLREPSRRSSPRWTADGPGCRDLAVTTSGFATFVLVDCVMMYAPFQMEETPSLLPQLLTLILLAFGLGGLLVWHVRGAWRPFGLGLMLGWVFMTLISAGFLTGLNP